MRAAGSGICGEEPKKEGGGGGRKSRSLSSMLHARTEKLKKIIKEAGGEGMWKNTRSGLLEFIIFPQV